MREYNRQLALAEATKAKAEQDKREAGERASRDVVAEVSRAVEQADADAEAKRKPKPKPKKKPKGRVAESGRSALENRRAQIDEAVEGKK